MGGEFCQNDICEILTPCTGTDKHGRCIVDDEVDRGYRCECEDGYDGEHCDKTSCNNACLNDPIACVPLYQDPFGQPHVCICNTHYEQPGLWQDKSGDASTAGSGTNDGYNCADPTDCNSENESEMTTTTPAPATTAEAGLDSAMEQMVNGLGEQEATDPNKIKSQVTVRPIQVEIMDENTADEMDCDGEDRRRKRRSITWKGEKNQKLPESYYS